MEITPLPVPFNGNSIKLRMVQWHDENETRIEVCLQETQERAEVTFDAVIGIRILYELDTSEFWLSTPRNILSSSWIFHVQSGGWFEFESQREDFYSKHEDINIFTHEKRLDLLALAYFLNKNMTKDEIKREIKLMAKIDDIEEISDMLLRGYAEIKQYIHDKADDNIKGLFTCINRKFIFTFLVINPQLSSLKIFVKTKTPLNSCRYNLLLLFSQ